MKLVIFGAVAMVVGLAAGTGTRVLTSPALPAGADSLIAAADSAYRAKAAHGGGAHGAVAAESHGVSAAPASHGEPEETVAASAPHADAASAPVASPAPPPPPAPHLGAPAAGGAPPSVPDGPSPERFKQVGNILLAMKPAEAAQVIGYLDNAQVQGLLEAMGPRQAATLLSQLPAERAAILSKRLLALPRPEAR